MLQLFATPWWVNLAILLPFVAYALWRKEKLTITRMQLLWTGIFGIAFGIEEVIVVVYLRVATGLQQGVDSSLAALGQFATATQAQAFAQASQSLIQTEIVREEMTLIIILSVALVLFRTKRERCAIFLWMFALWDIFYYVGLWFAVQWPPSLLTPDVLFLIPVPWMSQVWFPLLVSALTLLAVALCLKRE